MLKYRIALINVFWTEEDINTRYFDSVEAQSAYFDNLTEGLFTPLSNFNMGNNISTAITYRDLSGRDGETLCRCNYAVVQRFDDTTGAVVSRRYFFAYPTQDSAGQMRVTLSLDDIQTNYFMYKDQIGPCMIKRANLNRFIDNGDGTVSFDGTTSSKLFTSEAFSNVSKRLTKRTALDFEPATSIGNVLNDWLKQNVVGWEYIYLTEKDNYSLSYVGTSDRRELPLKASKIYPYDNFEVTNFEEDANGIESSLVCLCFPIYNKYTNNGKSNVIKTSDGRTAISSIGMNIFRENNNNNSFVYARKFSLIPPFPQASYPNSVCYLEDSNLILSTMGGDKPQLSSVFGIRLIPCGTTDDGDGTYTNHGVFQVTFQYGLKILTENYVCDKQLSFAKIDLIEGNKDPVYNPKLLSNEFFEINVVKGAQKFTYDYQKLNRRNFQISYSEAMTPDVTKGYARISDTNGVYISDCEENLTGLVYSDDNSLMVDNDQLSQMLANNKNYFLQQAIDIGTDFVSGVATKNLKQTTGSVFDLIDKYLTLDNMRSAPRMISNANGNAYFSSMIAPYKITVEEYDILDNEKEIINDYLCEYGFAYNHTGLVSDFDNIRKYYNYLEAEVEVISAPISNTEKDRLKRRLLSVRFWNSDTIQYDRENYERWLEA